MSAADFVSEWFESEPLRAAIAAGGIFRRLWARVGREHGRAPAANERRRRQARWSGDSAPSRRRWPPRLQPWSIRVDAGVNRIDVGIAGRSA
jgi:hypothetical protein